MAYVEAVHIRNNTNTIMTPVRPGTKRDITYIWIVKRYTCLLWPFKKVELDIQIMIHSNSWINLSLEHNSCIKPDRKEEFLPNFPPSQRKIPLFLAFHHASQFPICLCSCHLLLVTSVSKQVTKNKHCLRARLTVQASVSFLFQTLHSVDHDN